ncbi:MAG: RnfABCDGE type electron transport complex subunit G [Candidatus Omnitrophota bacterium]
MSESIKYILTLTLICFVTAVLLTGVYFLTSPKILAQKEMAEKEALEEVFPRAGYFEAVEQEGRPAYFRAYSSADKKDLLGYVFKTAGKGYSSVIEAMSGMDTAGRITGIKVLAQNETPGLGAKINEILEKRTLAQAIKELFLNKKKPAEPAGKPWFCLQFGGRRIEDLTVVKTAAEKNIQAITGATISSRALTDSVRKRAEEILQYER